MKLKIYKMYRRIVTAKKGIYLFACKARHNDYTLDYINKEDI